MLSAYFARFSESASPTRKLMGRGSSRMGQSCFPAYTTGLRACRHSLYWKERGADGILPSTSACSDREGLCLQGQGVGGSYATSIQLSSVRADLCNAGRPAVRLPALPGSIRTAILAQEPEWHQHPRFEGEQAIYSMIVSSRRATCISELCMLSMLACLQMMDSACSITCT